jgi:hypothetical protein
VTRDARGGRGCLGLGLGRRFGGCTGDVRGAGGFCKRGRAYRVFEPMSRAGAIGKRRGRRHSDTDTFTALCTRDWRNTLDDGDLPLIAVISSRFLGRGLIANRAVAQITAISARCTCFEQCSFAPGFATGMAGAVRIRYRLLRTGVHNGM